MDLKVSRILHAGFVFQSGNTCLAFDPIFENPFGRNAFAFPNIKFDLHQIQDLRFSAVFISHYHDDHLSLESLNLLDRSTPIYLFCVFEEMFDLIRRLGFSNVISVQWNSPIRIGEFTVTAKRALDADVDCLFQIQVGNVNILNVVDSWIDDQTLQQLTETKWDLILWPFQTMRELEVLSPIRAQASTRELPIEWLQQLQLLKPRSIIPSSCQFQMETWSWYNQAFFPISYAGFATQIQNILPNTEIQRLDPGCSLEWNPEISGFQPAKRLAWIEPLEFESIDYAYQPDAKPMDTSEIARHFPALSSNEQTRVLEFCQSELPARYKSFADSESQYFQKPRIWQLSLFDHQGQANIFTYRIQNGTLTLVQNNTEQISWVTEIPVSRLLGALQDEESLTSLYIRINNQIFEDEIEQDLQDVELTEDPLIRCLYTGQIGSYQKAQLARILNR